MNILFASDLHGEARLYDELRELAARAAADVIILGGDLLPSLPPLKRYEEMIPHQIGFIELFLVPFLNSIKKSTAVSRVLTIPGNWDLGYPLLFENPRAEMLDLTGKSFRLDSGYEVIGYPFVPPTPFRPKEYEKMDDPESPWPAQKFPSYVRAVDHSGGIAPVDPYVYLRGRETIRDDLNGLVRPLDLKKTICVMHSPPFGTRLDLTRSGSHAGSRSIASFIKRRQPLLSLHGHIHEAPEMSGSYVDKIGETLCINPGQFARTGSNGSRLSAVTFEMENPEETLVHTIWEKT